MNGIQALSEIKIINPDLPVILISGTGEMKFVIQALRLGAWDYLTKPIIDMDILEHSINNCLDKVKLIKENKKYQKNLEQLVHERTEELEKKTVELQKLLNEKDFLLKEVHHRVKNNLQIIYGLITIYMMDIDDNHIKYILKGTQLRISSLALVYKNLHQQELSSLIYLNNYLESIKNNIFSLYPNYNNAIKLDINEEKLHIDLAIYLGLLINEVLLLTLAINNEKNSSIKILFNFKENYQLIFEFTNFNLPENSINEQNDDFSNNLIFMMIEQLNAKIKLKTSENIQILDIIFPKANMETVI